MSVSRLHAHYRLGAGSSGARARLERTLQVVLDEGLEQALARSGVPAHEEICVRSAHASVQVREANPDSVVVDAWSRALADSIAGAIARGGPDVIRYRTRTHALVDLLEGVASRDLRRSWAWRQLDLWRADASVSPAAAAEQAVRALLREPGAIVGALAGAARGGALPGLVRALPVQGWRELARAGLAAGSVTPGTTAALLDPARMLPAPGSAPAPLEPAEPRTAVAAPGVGAVTRAVDRIARGSAIARALGAVAGAEPAATHAILLLAVLETDAGELLRGADHGRDLTGALAAALGGGAAAAPHGAAKSMDGSATAAVPATRARDRGRPGQAAASEPTAHGDGGAGRPIAPDRTGAGLRAREHGPAGVASRPAVPAGGPEGDDRPLPDLTARAGTEVGGLLFLLHVVRELELPAEILADPSFRERSLRWVLHRLALRLLERNSDDPAVLAFAGIAPGAPLPWRGEDPPSGEEEAAVARLAAGVAARTYERIERRPPVDERAAAAVVRACVRRRAELVCEPGWFDVHLRLDEVVVEVRRAGLDLDPGWIPWLGIVVRLVYG